MISASLTRKLILLLYGHTSVTMQFNFAKMYVYVYAHLHAPPWSISILTQIIYNQKHCLFLQSSLLFLALLHGRNIHCDFRSQVMRSCDRHEQKRLRVESSPRFSHCLAPNLICCNIFNLTIIVSGWR